MQVSALASGGQSFAVAEQSPDMEAIQEEELQSEQTESPSDVLGDFISDVRASLNQRAMAPSDPSKVLSYLA